MRHQQYIMALTNISAEAYSQQVFECAEAFLMSYYGQDEEVCSLLMKTPAFWQWWSEQFDQRDEAFCLTHAFTDAPYHIMFILWVEHHSVQNMVAFPGQHVIEAAMTQVWSSAWKVQHKENITAKQ